MKLTCIFVAIICVVGGMSYRRETVSEVGSYPVHCSTDADCSQSGLSFDSLAWLGTRSPFIRSFECECRPDGTGSKVCQQMVLNLFRSGKTIGYNYYYCVKCGDQCHDQRSPEYLTALQDTTESADTSINGQPELTEGLISCTTNEICISKTVPSLDHKDIYPDNSCVCKQVLDGPGAPQTCVVDMTRPNKFSTCIWCGDHCDQPVKLYEVAANRWNHYQQLSHDVIHPTSLRLNHSEFYYII